VILTKIESFIYYVHFFKLLNRVIRWGFSLGVDSLAMMLCWLFCIHINILFTLVNTWRLSLKLKKHECKLNFTCERYELVMNLPTNITKLFYQFHEPSKLVHDSFKFTWHVARLNSIIIDLYLQQFHESSKPTS